MASPPFLGNSATVERNASHVEAQADAIHDGAPAGLFFSESELPVAGTFSHPMTLGGYSASPSRCAQPQADDPTHGTGTLPPSGLRR